MNKWCGLIVLLLVAALGAMTWFFVLRGSSVQGQDGRTVVMLSPSDRDFLLAEMRGWLESVQGIAESISGGDFKAAAAEARKAGEVNLQQIPPSLLRALPAELKQLGFGTHAAFRDLAKVLEEGTDARQGLKMLSALMTNCIGCHASYRVEAIRQ